MAETPITQTLETIKTHPDFDETSGLAELFGAAEDLRDRFRAGDWDSQPHLQLGVTDNDKEFSGLWKFPEGRLHTFALRFGHDSVSMSLMQRPEVSSLPSVGSRRLASYSILGFTVGYNPNPPQVSFRLEYDKEFDDNHPGRDRGLLPPRSSLYVDVSARDPTVAANLDAGAEPRIDEFAEIFFNIPAEAGLYGTARQLAHQKRVAQAQYIKAA